VGGDMKKPWFILRFSGHAAKAFAVVFNKDSIMFALQFYAT
jgi:hypothetical protein